MRFFKQFPDFLERIQSLNITSDLHMSIKFIVSLASAKRHVFFKKRWANPGLFLFIFGLFKQTIQFLQQINVTKCHVHPVSGAGIRTQDVWNVSLLL